MCQPAWATRLVFIPFGFMPRTVVAQLRVPMFRVGTLSPASASASNPQIQASQSPVPGGRLVKPIGQRPCQPVYHSQEPASKKKKRDCMEWVGRSAAMRAKLSMPSSARPWTSQPGVFLRGLQATERVMDLLDIAWYSETRHCRSAAEVSEVRRSLVVDCSQGVDRYPWSKTMRTITTGSEYYSFAMDRRISEEEKFALLGFEGPASADLPDAALRDLCGEAMALPSVGSILLSMAIALDFDGLWAA